MGNIFYTTQDEPEGEINKQESELVIVQNTDTYAEIIKKSNDIKYPKLNIDEIVEIINDKIAKFYLKKKMEIEKEEEKQKEIEQFKVSNIVKILDTKFTPIIKKPNHRSKHRYRYRHKK